MAAQPLRHTAFEDHATVERLERLIDQNRRVRDAVPLHMLCVNGRTVELLPLHPGFAVRVGSVAVYGDQALQALDRAIEWRLIHS